MKLRVAFTTAFTLAFLFLVLLIVWKEEKSIDTIEVTSVNYDSDKVNIKPGTSGEVYTVREGATREEKLYKVSEEDNTFIRQALSLYFWQAISKRSSYSPGFSLIDLKLDGADKGLYIETEAIGEKDDRALGYFYENDPESVIDYFVFLQAAYAYKNIYEDYNVIKQGNGKDYIVPGRVEFCFGTFSGNDDYLKYRNSERVITPAEYLMVPSAGEDADKIYSDMSIKWHEVRENRLSDEVISSYIDKLSQAVADYDIPEKSGYYKSDNDFAANDYYLDGINSFKDVILSRMARIDAYYNGQCGVDEDGFLSESYAGTVDLHLSGNRRMGEAAIIDINDRDIFIDGMPSIFINTSNGTLDYIEEVRGNKEKGVFLALDENGEVDSEGSLVWFKGKGHSSFGHSDKKSFQFMFSDSTNVLGMGSGSTYVLQANALDMSRIRNATAYTMAKALNIPYTTDFKYVNLYVNGLYHGLYMLIEPVMVGEGRVSVDDTYALFEVNGDQERNAAGNIYFMDDNGLRYELSYPETMADSEVEELADILSEYRRSALSGDMSCIDMDSFAGMFFMDMIFDDVDANFLSTYYYLNSSMKMYAGPVWDYDLTLGNHGEREIDRGDSSFVDGWPEWLYENQEFKALLREKWNNGVRDEFTWMAEQGVFDISDSISSAALYDEGLWSYEDRTASSEEQREKSVLEVSEFMKGRIELLDRMLK